MGTPGRALDAVPAGDGRREEPVSFAHNAEGELAAVLDFYGIEWEYEPTTFVLESGPDGLPTLAFTPDFYLPGFDCYLEVTTLDQRLVTKKNRKLRRLRELHPEIDVRIIYQRDYHHLLVKYGLARPEQHAASAEAGRPLASAGEELGLLGGPPVPVVPGVPVEASEQTGAA